MVAKSLRWVLAGLAACPPAAMALGLGDIHLLSTLDAPLNAEIELIGATPDELASLKPEIASREIFSQHGLDWSEALSGVTLRAVHTADGRDVIKLQSTEPITEPFITLLVEVDWDRGRLVHEYDVLLDPPLYTPNQGQAAHAPVAAPVSGSEAHEGSVERTAPAPAPAAAAPQAPAAASETAGASSGGASGASSSSSDSYDVHRGDTLSGIAARFAGGGRADQQRWMVAAYQSNPSAFVSNMNLLRAGAVLRIPSSAEVAAVSPSQASSEVHRQYAAWRSGPAQQASGTEQPGQLRLVAPGEASSTAGAAGAGASTGSRSDVKALQGEVQDLKTQLSESHRLLEVQNAELADLRAKLAARQAGAAATSPAQTSLASASSAAAQPPAAPPSAGQASESVSAAAPPPPAAASSASMSSAAPLAAANAPGAHKPARHPKVLRPAVPQTSWLTSLMGLWWVLALGIVAVLGFFGVRAWSARRAAGFDDSLGRLAEAGAASRPHDHEPSFTDTATTPQLAPRESNFLVEESGTHERPRIGGAAAAAARRVESDETISAETAINLDQGDPLAEADFHMAYGLYDQAADLIRIAIQREPARRDLKLKLLEVFFVWGNKEQFLQTARDLAATREQAAPGEWEKIVIMGKQLAPDDPLFAGGAAVSGAAAGGVDLDLEGGQHRVDFDILGEPIAHGQEGVDLDIGTAIGERDPKAETAAHQATDKNLALDDSAVLTEETTAEREVITPTRQMTQQMTAKLESTLGNTREMSTREMTMRTREMTQATRELTQATRELTSTFDRNNWESQGASGEVPTVEQPALQSPETSTIRRKVEMALKQGAGEHTTEVAIDDLGLDLNALEPDAHGAAAGRPEGGLGADAPTLVAGLDERSRRDMESAQGGELKISETGSWHFDDDPFAGNGAAERGGEAAELASLKSSATVDFEVGEPDAVAHGNGAHGATGLDMDVGTATSPDIAYTATQRLGSDDLALPDLEPVTMSEVGTKLDLARAYMDMGDPEGARNILEEVLNEGSVAQKQEAERLIASLPG